MGAAASSNVAAPASSSHVAAPASSSSHVAARRLRLVPVVAPRPIAPLARSVNAGIAPTALTLGLPVAKYAAFAAQGYSNTWLNDLHLSDECLEPFVSKHKLDLLVQEGALKIGDELYMEVDVSVEEGEMQVVEKVAKIISVNARSHPDVEVYDLRGNVIATIGECKGPTEIVQELKRRRPELAGQDIRQPWKLLFVYSGGRWMGTLKKVRQSLHRWQIEMAAWRAWKDENGVE
ncbi:MAG: hypothetical protein HETSPECPRED_002520 [Heterodermia speciosa]|uniref:Uncharacterized protein n=1 Tax=Heterodermia speciosa TaxID=116794 RepID=A0A8H3EZV5_9LECA|nr:MAG: hypothetical protein HETSPECPRED_002520 [Heterodermia speciosa]